MGIFISKSFFSLAFHSSSSSSDCYCWWWYFVFVRSLSLGVRRSCGKCRLNRLKKQISNELITRLNKSDTERHTDKVRKIIRTEERKRHRVKMWMANTMYGTLVSCLVSQGSERMTERGMCSTRKEKLAIMKREAYNNIFVLFHASLCVSTFSSSFVMHPPLPLCPIAYALYTFKSLRLYRIHVCQRYVFPFSCWLLPVELWRHKG